MSKRAMPLVLALGLFLPSLTSMCLPSGSRLPPTMRETATASVDLAQEKATEVATTTPEAETPTPTLESKETMVPLARDCFADVPEYPGAKRDEEKEAELESWIQRFGIGELTIEGEGEGRIYITADSLEEVIEFYGKELPERGWTIDLAWGGVILSWKDVFVTYLIIDRIEEENLIFVECYVMPMPVTRRFLAAAAPDVSKDGVELTDFFIGGPGPTQVGDTLRVSFTLRNTTDSEMNFSPYGVFVGCRDPDDENCDFGYKELTLKPEESFTLKNATIEVDKPGIWHFWPGYYLGHWGPYKWQELRIEVE